MSQIKLDFVGTPRSRKVGSKGDVAYEVRYSGNSFLSLHFLAFPYHSFVLLPLRDQ